MEIFISFCPGDGNGRFQPTALSVAGWGQGR